MEAQAEEFKTNTLRPSAVKQMMIDRLSILQAYAKPKELEETFNDIEDLLNKTIYLISLINERNGICRSVWNDFYKEKNKHDNEIKKLKEEVDIYLKYKVVFDTDIGQFVNTLYTSYQANLQTMRNFQNIFEKYWVNENEESSQLNFIKIFLDSSITTYESRISDFKMLFHTNNRKSKNHNDQYEILSKLGLRDLGLEFTPSDVSKMLTRTVVTANNQDMNEFSKFLSSFKLFVDRLSMSVNVQEGKFTELKTKYDALVKESNEYFNILSERSILEKELNEYKISLEACHNLLKNFESNDYLQDINAIKNFYKNSTNISKIQTKLTRLMESSLSRVKENLLTFLESDEFNTFKEKYGNPPILDSDFLQTVFKSYIDSNQLEMASKNTIKTFIKDVGPTFQLISESYKYISNVSNDLPIDESLQELEKIRVLYESVSAIAKNFIQISDYFGSLINVDLDSTESSLEVYQTADNDEVFTNFIDDEQVNSRSQSNLQLLGVNQNNVYKNMIDSTGLDLINEQIFLVTVDGVKRTRVSETGIGIETENSDSENTENTNILPNRKRTKNRNNPSTSNNNEPEISNDEQSSMQTDADSQNEPILISDTSTSVQDATYITSTPKKQKDVSSRLNKNLQTVDESVINISDDSNTGNINIYNENANDNEDMDIDEVVDNTNDG